MKIVILSTFYPFRGGIAQFNAQLYKEFSKQYEVVAFTFTRQYPSLLFPGKTQYVTEQDNAQVIPAKQILDSINPISWYKTVKIINKLAPDILLLRFWHPFFAPCLGMIAGALKKNIKVISLLDNVIPHEDKAIYRPFIRYFLRQSNGFITMSETVRQDLHRFIPDAPCLIKQHPLYNHFGSKQDRKKSLYMYGLEENKKTILFFGFIREYKGLDILINAFGKLNDSYQLIIAGESYTDFAKYQKLIDINSNKNRILLLNRYIADEEVSHLFSCADVCVQPYRSATQSGITAVSYHFDVPMIVTNVGGLKQDIIHEHTGLIVDKPIAQDIAEGIQKYFSNNRDIVFRSNILKLKKELSWESFCHDIISFSEKIK